MSNLFNQSELINYIENIINDNIKLETIAKQSYIHFNGFVKIPIQKTNNKITRIHIWKISNEEQNPHSHGWHFRSKIIKGKFINTLFTETLNENLNYNKNIIYLNKNTHSSNIEHSEYVGLSIKSSSTYMKNDVYEINNTDIHTFHPLENMSITLIEMTTNHDDVAYIYSKDEHVKGGRCPNLSVNELKEYLIYVLNEIKET